MTPVITMSHDTLFSSAFSGNQWYNPSGVIAGATNNFYVVTTNGVYWTIVTLNGCSSLNSNTIDVATGIDEIANNTSIDIYPVPNDGQFTVSMNTMSEKHFDISVYDALGTLVYAENDVVVNGKMDHHINIALVPVGIYYVAFRSDDGQITRKILISR
jgi:hypothetical protein